MNTTNRLIVHGLMKVEDRYLLIRRTEVKRGKPNMYPKYWDIPGGMVEKGELPKEALVRETKEEVNLDIKVNEIIYEDSNFDRNKDIVFTRLVYLCDVINNDKSNIILQVDEHDYFKLISSLDEMKDEKVVGYVEDIWKRIKQ